MNRVDSCISIIIPCYNAEQWVAETLESCLAQTYRPLEIIVVDDGSTDGSLSIIERYAQQHPDMIQYETGPNRGGCAARNRGFARSSGEYVMFLDADDLIAPDTIAVLVPHLAARHTVAACRWQYLILTETGWRNLFPPAPTQSDEILNYLTGLFVPPCALLWQSETVEAIGGWDETLQSYQDGDFMLRALFAGVRLVRVDGGMGYYRRHSQQSVSRIVSKNALVSRMRVLEKTEETLRNRGDIQTYMLALGRAYHGLATQGFRIDRTIGKTCQTRARRLAGYRAIVGTYPHVLLCLLIGTENKVHLAGAVERLGLASYWRQRWQNRRNY